MQEAVPRTTLQLDTHDVFASSTGDLLQLEPEHILAPDDYARAQAFFHRVQRPCCPQEFPGFAHRSEFIQMIAGEHTVPDPALPFWWTEGIVNSHQAKEQQWLRELLAQVTWQEMMEGRISDAKLKDLRQNWTPEQRKLVSSPKLGNMLNVLFIDEPRQVQMYQKRRNPVSRIPLWWYHLALLSISYANMTTARFLAQTSVEEFNSGAFDLERFTSFCDEVKRRQPKNASVETFLRQTFGEFPQVITRFNQRGAKTPYVMRITGDPYSIVTMSSRSPHWTSCQNPLQNDTHEMSHKVWANLLDPNMALMEMIDPTIDEDQNLVARAIIRVVHDRSRALLYLDCLYGERGYISSFVTLTRKLSETLQVQPVSGRMIPFYTSVTTSLHGDPVDFQGYEPPYLDLGQWKKLGSSTQFVGDGHYIVSKDVYKD